MDPQGKHHRINECELDHECDQEIQEVIQQVFQRVIHPESNGYESDHESGQKVVQQTNHEQDNRSKLVHGLDKIEPQENSEDEGSHGSMEISIRETSIARRYRWYILHFNLKVLDWRIRDLEWTQRLLHRHTITASVAVIDDAADVDLPIEELSLSRTSTPLPKNSGIPGAWPMVTREIAGDPCFFILYYSQSKNGTAVIECISPEYYERLARSSQSTESLQGESSTTQAPINFDIDIVIVPEEILGRLTRLKHWNKIRKLCVVLPKNSSNPKGNSNRLSPLTMRRLNRLSALDILTIFATNSGHAQRHFPEEDFVRYARGIKQYIESRTSLQRIDPIQEGFRLSIELVYGVNLPHRDGQHGKN
ncbi:uncharacterized protein EAF01_009353 [Botrytis porri]|uniref:uncharacterized protein n=1 Tax=Botrytis porri TaxID=87229 RepID=UPI00190192A2|nr:uncharacterized protein EAF01_009353 [Botrytis porri]KAF7896950.1 hypothetical protein EAF01_009353 [Botrytis porri]